MLIPEPNRPACARSCAACPRHSAARRMPAWIPERPGRSGMPTRLPRAERRRLALPRLRPPRPVVVLVEEPRLPRLHRNDPAVDDHLLAVGRHEQRVAVRNLKIRHLADLDRTEPVADAQDLRG